MGTLQDKAESRAKKQQMDMFKEQLKKMLEGPLYSMSSWSAELDEAMSSWKMMVPGAKSQPEVQKMIAFKDIIAKMTPGQKSDPERLLKNETAIGKLAVDSGKSAEDVRSMIMRFQSLVMFQKFVRERKAAGRRLPKNVDDMQELLKVDMQKDMIAKQRKRNRRF